MPRWKPHAPSERFREDLQPVVTVTAELEGRDLGSVDRDVRAALRPMRLPAGYRTEYGGQQASQREAFRNPAVVAVGGLLLTLRVLTAQFRRVRPSVAVLLTTPFALAVLGGSAGSKFLNLVAPPSRAVLCGLGAGAVTPRPGPRPAP